MALRRWVGAMWLPVIMLAVAAVAAIAFAIYAYVADARDDAFMGQ